MNTSDILHLIETDADMMDILRTVEELHLPDWAIGAGFVRNKVWDTLHAYDRKTPPSDIDVVFFDATGKTNNKEINERLSTAKPALRWEAVNQATIHTLNGEHAYTSTEDALSKWPETATAVAVTLDGERLRLIAPHGIDDLVGMIVRPTPAFASSADKIQKVRDRVTSKRWLEKWPKLQIRMDE